MGSYFEDLEVWKKFCRLSVFPRKNCELLTDNREQLRL